MTYDDVSLIQVGISTNLVANPGFESGPNENSATNWTLSDDTSGKYPATGFFRSTWGTAAPHSGSYGLSISNKAYGILRTDNITVSANTQYDLYAYVRGFINIRDSIGFML